MTWLKAASSSRCETRFAWLISYRHTYLYTYLSTYPVRLTLEVNRTSCASVRMLRDI